jgi:hypothetical protein
VRGWAREEHGLMRIRIVITLLDAVFVAGHAMADVTIIATQKGKGLMAGLASGDSEAPL